MVNEQLISDYLTRRGVNGFVFGGGRFGVTGPEITIDNSSSTMSIKLNNACNDALISRGGGGMGGSYAYRQISPECFSDPKVRAEAMLDAFERSGTLTLPNEYHIFCDAKANLLGPSEEIVCAADQRTLRLHVWLEQNQHLWAQVDPGGVTQIDVESSWATQAFQDRVANLSSLHKGAGPAYTLAVVALDAISCAKGAALAVDWGQVDKQTIAMCILKHGQSNQSVAHALEEFSPGTVTPFGLQAMRVELARVEQATSHPSDDNRIGSSGDYSP